MPQAQSKPTGSDTTRRGFLALILMSAGLVLSYGLLAVEGFLFLLPERLKPKGRYTDDRAALL